MADQDTTAPMSTENTLRLHAGQKYRIRVSRDDEQTMEIVDRTKIPIETADARGSGQDSADPDGSASEQTDRGGSARDGQDGAAHDGNGDATGAGRNDVAGDSSDADSDGQGGAARDGQGSAPDGQGGADSQRSRPGLLLIVTSPEGPLPAANVEFLRDGDWIRSEQVDSSGERYVPVGSGSALAPGAYTLKASLNGFASAEKPAEVAEDEAVTVRFELHPNGAISLDIRDATGPADARYRVVGPDFEKSAELSAGVAFFPAPVGSHEVTLSKAGFADAVATLEVTEGETATLEKVLGESLNQQVVDEKSGTPLAGIDVTRRRTDDPAWEARVSTDVEGYARFEGVGEGAHSLDARDADGVYSPASVTVELPREGEPEPIALSEGILTLVVTVLEKPGTSAFDMDSQEGAPVVGATVALRTGEDKVGEQTTNDEGECKFSGLSPGTHTIVARHPDYEQDALEIPLRPSGSSINAAGGLGGRRGGGEADSVNATIKLRSLKNVGKLTVEVVDEEGRPVANASVEAKFMGGTGFDPRKDPEPASTDGDGRAELVSLPTGRHRVTAEIEGSYAEQDVSVRGGDNAVTLTIADVETREILVKDSRTGEPVAGATVVLEASRTHMEETGSDGLARFEKLPAGNYPAKAGKNDEYQMAEATLTVGGGETAEIEVERTMVQLTVYMTERLSGVPFKDAVISLTGINGLRETQTETTVLEESHNLGAAAIFGPVPWGEYELECSYESVSSGVLSRSVQPGSDSRGLQLSLPLFADEGDFLSRLSLKHELEIAGSSVDLTGPIAVLPTTKLSVSSQLNHDLPLPVVISHEVTGVEVEVSTSEPSDSEYYTSGVAGSVPPSLSATCTLGSLSVKSPIVELVFPSIRVVPRERQGKLVGLRKLEDQLVAAASPKDSESQASYPIGVNLEMSPMPHAIPDTLAVNVKFETNQKKFNTDALAYEYVQHSPKTEELTKANGGIEDVLESGDSLTLMLSVLVFFVGTARLRFALAAGSGEEVLEAEEELNLAVEYHQNDNTRSVVEMIVKDLNFSANMHAALNSYKQAYSAAFANFSSALEEEQKEIDADAAEKKAMAAIILGIFTAAAGNYITGPLINALSKKTLGKVMMADVLKFDADSNSLTRAKEAAFATTSNSFVLGQIKSSVVPTYKWYTVSLR